MTAPTETILPGDHVRLGVVRAADVSRMVRHRDGVVVLLTSGSMLLIEAEVVHHAGEVLHPHAVEARVGGCPGPEDGRR